MIEDGMHVRRKDRLRMPIDGNCRVCPPQERLRLRRPIIQLYLYFQVGLPWVEGEACRHFRPIHPVDFADPRRFTATGMMFNTICNRSERIRTMMLGPVELDSTRNPGTGQSNQRWFDDTVIVNEIVAVCFIKRPVDTPAELRQNLDVEILVFEKNNAICLWSFLVPDLVYNRVRVYLPRTALIYSFLQKHRIFVRLPGTIRRNFDIFFPYMNLGSCHWFFSHFIACEALRSCPLFVS